MAIDKAVDSTVLDGYFSDIADAIRDKDGTQNTYTPAQMPTAIENIPTGGGSSHNWEALGYSGEPASITSDYNYSKSILDNWDASQTSLYQKFYQDSALRFMPLVDTSNATDMSQMFQICNFLVDVPLLNTENVNNMSSMFQSCDKIVTIPLFDTKNVINMGSMFKNCTALKNVPLLNTEKVKGTNAFQNTFSSCPNLTDASLDNILQMCINATSYTSAKTLVRIGITSTFYPASRIEALPHYQDFIDAGWTTGY